MHAMPHLRLAQLDDGVLARVTQCDLEAGAALVLVDEICSAIDEAGPVNVYLDFGQVEFISSGALGQLVVLDRKLRETGGRLGLFSLNPLVSEVFLHSHLSHLLDAHGIPLPP